MPTSSGKDDSPKVAREDWPHTKILLTQAAKLSKEDRRRFIAAACANRPELRDELLSILESYDTASRVCEARPPNVVPPVRKKLDPILHPDSTYGPYRVLKQLGAGGMGQVFLALDERLNRKVAVKSLAGKWLESPIARQRLMREARSAAALTHPHIATLYDVLEADGQLLLVMEYVEGRSANARLEEGPIPIGHALRLAIQMSDAVCYAHDRGIIHCDIKPANVQIAVDGNAKVLDFGLARARYDVGDADEVALAEQGKLVGTVGYMAPERLIEGTLNASGDIYSLGVVIFEMVTGQRFFDGRDLPAFLLTVLGSQVPKPSAAVSWVPTALDEVVERALAKKPSQRYQSARELSRDLQNVLALVEGSGSGVVFPPPGPVVQRDARTRFLLQGLVAVVLMLAVITLAGFVTTAVYNVRIGSSDFVQESALSWPYWGLRSMVTPVGVSAIAGVGLALIISACRMLCRGLAVICGPVRRMQALLRARFAFWSEGLRSMPIATIAAPVLFANLAAVALLLWRYSELLQGLQNFIQRSPEHLGALSPGNSIQQNMYRRDFSLIVFAFGFAWYQLIRLWLGRREREGGLLLAGGLALSVLSICLLAAPWRILRHNTSERVSYSSDACYLVEQRGDEGVLFCPLGPQPWNRIVKLNDPALTREHKFGNIFENFGTAH